MYFSLTVQSILIYFWFLVAKRTLIDAIFQIFHIFRVICLSSRCTLTTLLIWRTSACLTVLVAFKANTLLILVSPKRAMINAMLWLFQCALIIVLCPNFTIDTVVIVRPWASLAIFMALQASTRLIFESPNLTIDTVAIAWSWASLAIFMALQANTLLVLVSTRRTFFNTMLRLFHCT